MVNKSVKKFKNAKATTKFIIAGLVPSLIWYFVFAGLPILYSFYLSFYKWDFINTGNFVGLENYAKALTNDRLFYKSLYNTVNYTISTVFIGGILAFVFAILMNNLKKTAAVFRTIFFLPVVSSMAAVAVLWRWLYQPKFGVINQFLGLFGISRLMWLQSPDTTMLSVIITSIWKGLGFTIVIFLAGLQGIPQSLYEAAEVDGANRWQKIRHITIPLLRPTTVFVLITGVIGGLQAFTQMYVLTGGSGGPLDSARTLVFHLYEKAFDFFQMGRAAAIAFILFVIIIILTLVQLKLTHKPVQY